MYMTDFAYDGPILLIPLSPSYPSSPVVVVLIVIIVAIVEKVVAAVLICCADLHIYGNFLSLLWFELCLLDGRSVLSLIGLFRTLNRKMILSWKISHTNFELL